MNCERIIGFLVILAVTRNKVRMRVIGCFLSARFTSLIVLVPLSLSYFDSLAHSHCSIRSFTFTVVSLALLCRFIGKG